MFKMTPAIWVLSTDSTWGPSSTVRWPGLFTSAQQARLERLRQTTMLFRGEHREYFLHEGRTQFDFPFVRMAGDREARMYTKCNALKLIAIKSADLLLSKQPLIRASNELEQKYINDLDERTDLQSVLYEAALECCYQGETALESMIVGGQVYLQSCDMSQLFPVGPMLPNRQFAQYDKYEIHNTSTQDSPSWLCLITSYLPGAITRVLWRLSDKQELLTRLTLDQWPLDKNLLDKQSTGIAANTITWIPNLLQLRCPCSDFDGVLDLQDALNAKQTQISRVLSKHSDPKLAAPEAKADEKGDLPSNADVYWFRNKDEIPQYITWQAELDMADKDRSFVLNQLLIQTETSPVLLGMKEGAAPDAFKKVRLESFNSLTKAARKSLFWRAGIRRALSVCLDLQNTLPGHRMDRGPIAVELRDGIPVDDFEQAQTQNLLHTAGLQSLEDALEQRYGGDSAAVARELERIQSAHANATPSVLLGEPPINDTGPVSRQAGAADRAAQNSDTTEQGATL